MRKKLRATFVMVMVLAMLLGSTISVSATESIESLQTLTVSEETTETVEPVALYSASYPYTGLSNALPVNTGYKRLAYCSTSGSGFNCNVTIRCELNLLSNRGVVMMKDKNGKVLWTATSDYYVPSHGSYTFWCGSDVYSIWIKTTSGFGNAWVQR